MAKPTLNVNPAPDSDSDPKPDPEGDRERDPNLHQVGKEGVITVQDGQTLENELEVVEGMKCAPPPP